jgi:hypothetical protein
MAVTRILALAQHAGSALAISNVIKLASLDNSLHVISVGYKQSITIFENEGISYQTLTDSSRTCADDPSELDELVNDLVLKEHPDVLIAGSSRRRKGAELTLEQVSCKVSRILNLPIVMVLDYWGYYEERFDDPDTGEKNAFVPDRICAMDALAARELVARGIPEEAITVTGNPYYDDIAMDLKKDAHGHRDKQIPNSLNVLYQSQPILEDFGTVMGNGGLGYTQHSAFHDIVNVLRNCELTEVNLSVRKHLREQTDSQWDTILETYSNDPRIRIQFECEPKTQMDLNQFDLIVSHFSTTLIESIYRVIPTISYQPGHKATDTFIANQLGLSLPAYDLIGLKNAIKIALEPKYLAQLQDRCELLKREDLFFSSGNAAEKVLRVVKCIHD